MTVVVLTDPNTREDTTVRQRCPLTMALDVGVAGRDVQHATRIRAEFFVIMKHATPYKGGETPLRSLPECQLAFRFLVGLRYSYVQLTV